MSEVFLLGAGFSRAISDQMPVLQEMSELLRDRVDYPPRVGSLTSNVEHLMTYLSQSQPWLAEPDNLENRAAFLRVTGEIGNLLAERTRKAVENPCPEFLRTLVNYWHATQAVVITFNYDTLIERAIQQVEPEPGHYLAPDNIYPIPIQDVRRASLVFGATPRTSFKLHKLHGSVNWYYSGASTYFGETIYSVPVTKWGDLEYENEQQAQEAASDKVPLIIPPTSEKVGYFQHETIRLIWSKAGEALSSAHHLFCIGYSLPETDLSIRFFLKSLLPEKTPLSIVNIDTDLPGHYRSVLGDTFEISDKYVRSDALSRFATELH